MGTTSFLSRIGRQLWGPIEGGLAALAYVALPITLGYANFNDLEQPVMFGCVVATWGYVRFIRDGKDRYAAASVLGFLFAVNCDWWAYTGAASSWPGCSSSASWCPSGCGAVARGRSAGTGR